MRDISKIQLRSYSWVGEILDIFEGGQREGSETPGRCGEDVIALIEGWRCCSIPWSSTMEEDIFVIEESVGGGVQQVTKEHLTPPSCIIDKDRSSLNVLGVISLKYYTTPWKLSLESRCVRKKKFLCGGFLAALSVSRLYFWTWSSE